MLLPPELIYFMTKTKQNKHAKLYCYAKNLKTRMLLQPTLEISSNNLLFSTTICTLVTFTNERL